MIHIPVLQKEFLQYLDPKTNENFIDCTLGEAGHTAAILKKIGPEGKVLGIDWDENQIENCKLQIENFKERVIFVCDNFAHLKKIVEECKFKPVQGILFDLGMSSWHLEKSGRGFSFLREEPLDMRYSPKFPISNFQFPKLSAEKIVSEYSSEELERILREYGEERFTKRIVREIVKEREIMPIKTTFQLVEIVKRAVPRWYQHKKLHFATKTFQALRIAVNDELNNLKKGLMGALDVLSPQGRLVVISFHSLEDRIVKNFLKENSQKGLLKILTKKPITPTEEEVKLNPRSRSAKLRAALKLTTNN